MERNEYLLLKARQPKRRTYKKINKFTYREMMKNHRLQDYGFNNPVENKMEKEYKLAKDADIVKFETENQYIEGKFVNIEQSTLYPESWAVKIMTELGLKTVFVNNIVKEKLEIEDIKKGQEIKIVYKGLTKSATTGREYKNYDLYYVSD